jgi:hypothetical protein
MVEINQGLSLGIKSHPDKGNIVADALSKGHI